MFRRYRPYRPVYPRWGMARPGWGWRRPFAPWRPLWFRPRWGWRPYWGGWGGAWFVWLLLAPVMFFGLWLLLALLHGAV